MPKYKLCRYMEPFTLNSYGTLIEPLMEPI